MLGVLLATICWAGLSAVGLSQFAAGSPGVYAAMRVVGSLYLIWIGLRMLRGGWLNRYRSLDAPVEKRDARSIVTAGFVVNITNPKTAAYCGSVFAALIPPGSPGWLFAAAVATASAVSTSWWICVALAFSTDIVRRGFAPIRRALDLTMGAALVLLGARLAVGR